MKHSWLLIRFSFTVALVGFLSVMTGTHADESDVTSLLKTFVSEFVSITPGKGKFSATFEMGDPKGLPSEQPQHTVQMKSDFAIAKYEVPQNLYEAVTGKNPSRWKGKRNSVEMMTWDDANEFCTQITKLLRDQKLIDDNDVIRLPTEAEWEYCCRAGTTTRYSFGDQAQSDKDIRPKASILDAYGWHTGNAAGNDPPVGALKPNPWGLYDMHGYLCEFTADEWSRDFKQTPTDGSSVKPTSETTFIVIRGGSWKDDFEILTSASRRKLARTNRGDAVGIRCVKSK